jgi:hypothetical protein
MEDKEFVKFIKSLSPEIAREVKSANRRRKEHGFVICSTNRKLRIGGLCVGEKCGVELKPCPDGEKTIASFHTHPSDDILPSENDVMMSFLKGEEFLCIANKKSQTRCWRLAEWSDDLNDFLNNVRAGQNDFTYMSKGIKQLSTDIFRKEGKIIKQVAEFDARDY